MCLEMCKPTQTKLGLRLAITRCLVKEELFLTIWFNYLAQVNKLFENFGSMTARYERYFSLQKAHTSIIFLKEHMEFQFLGPF
jgi:hypothetical protein